MIGSKTLLASVAAWLSLFTPSADAHEFPPIAEDVAARVEACVVSAVERNGDGEECIGVIFDDCEGNAGSTYSMSACFVQERDFWQSMIGRTFDAVSQHYRATSRESVTGEPLSESLAKSQMAWSAFAEAQCRFAHDKFGTGSIRNIEAAACSRNLAAERAIFFRSLSAEG